MSTQSTEFYEQGEVEKSSSSLFLKIVMSMAPKNLVSICRLYDVYLHFRANTDCNAKALRDY